MHFFGNIPIKLKLTLGHGLWLAVLFSTLGYGLYRFIGHNMFTTVDAALLASAKNIRDNGSSRNYDPFFMESLLQDFLIGPHVRSSAQLVDLSGRVSAKTPNLQVQLPVTAEALLRARAHLETFETFRTMKGAVIRQVTLPVTSRTGLFLGQLVQVGTSLEPTLEALGQIGQSLALALTAGFLISVIFGYILTARSLKPVSAMTAAANKIGVDNLDLRLPVPKARDELQNLAETFNDLLSHLQIAIQRLRRFAGDVSHELRTPLSILRGEAELALRKERSPQEYQMTCNTILSEAEHMACIVEDLLLLARAQSRSLDIGLEGVPMDDFVSNLQVSLKTVFESKSLVLDCDTGEVPSFLANPSYFAIVIKNILQNAAKYSPPGSHILFEAKRNTQNESILFRIMDEGEGIAEKDLPFIFDLFYRADAARNRNDGGAGIGLSLAQALVQLHNGTITVKSTQGKGATFEIKIFQGDRSLKKV